MSATPETRQPWPLTRIISGGQSGADRAGLAAGWLLGYQTGGAVPRGCRTEDGPAPSLVSVYHCHESTSSRYDIRTLDNIRAATGTLICGDTSSPGTRLTLNLCQIWAPDHWILNPRADELRQWILDRQIQILNVAGNRESRNPGIYRSTLILLQEALVRP